MTGTLAPPTLPPIRERSAPSSLGRSLVGGFFLVMGGVHLGLVAADPQVYRHFADNGLFAFVRTGWTDIVMAAPGFYGLLLMAGEVTAGALLLVGGRAARVGWLAVIAFHFLLLVIPTTLMGLSLPLLARGAVAASREIAPLVGRL